VDRRAVFRALNWRSKAGGEVEGHHRAIMKSIACAAGTYQLQRCAAGLADSSRCPFCSEDIAEDAEHVYWECEAWGELRQEIFGAKKLDLSAVPPITRSCGLLVETEEERALERELGVPGDWPEVPDWIPGVADDTFSYGRRVAATDGSATGTKGPRRARRGGYGVAWGRDHPQNLAAELQGTWQSSQRAELSAVINALRIHKSGPLLVRSDSAWTLAGAFLLAAG